MHLRPILVLLCLCLAPMNAIAEQTVSPPQGQIRVQTAAIDPRVAALTDTMMMDRTIAVMRDEGLKYGQSLQDEMFPGRGGSRWQAIVGTIYDAERMRRSFDAALTRELSDAGDVLSQIEAYFGSTQGQAALALEIEARRALLDPEVEDAAKVAWEDMLAGNDPRVDLLRRFVEANDLIESNVMGALNANLAFYRGMAEAGILPQEMTEEQMLSDVWGQEDEVRAETEDWLYPFLALAYQPLSDADLEAYLAFSETQAGQRINAALFAAFDEVFTTISADLGRAVATQLQGEDI